MMIHVPMERRALLVWLIMQNSNVLFCFPRPFGMIEFCLSSRQMLTDTSNFNRFFSLRKLCCGGDSNFVSSIERCKNWDAKGGKSGSSFSKTLGTSYDYWGMVAIVDLFCVGRSTQEGMENESAGEGSSRVERVLREAMGSLNDYSLDDRFIIKKISRTELISFAEFGNSYFEYLCKSHYFKVRISYTLYLHLRRFHLPLPKYWGSTPLPLKAMALPGSRM